MSTTIEFVTNSPVTPLVEINATGEGLSQVSGEMCDIVWTAANSPYELTGDIEIPEGCTLTIEPGVTVVQNGSSIFVFGDLVAEGTESQPISITGGGLSWFEGASNQLSYVNRIRKRSLSTRYTVMDSRVMRDSTKVRLLRLWDEIHSLPEITPAEIMDAKFLLK